MTVTAHATRAPPPPFEVENSALRLSLESKSFEFDGTSGKCSLIFPSSLHLISCYRFARKCLFELSLLLIALLLSLSNGLILS